MGQHPLHTCTLGCATLFTPPTKRPSAREGKRPMTYCQHWSFLSLQFASTTGHNICLRCILWYVQGRNVWLAVFSRILVVELVIVGVAAVVAVVVAAVVVTVLVVAAELARGCNSSSNSSRSRISRSNRSRSSSSSSSITAHSESMCIKERIGISFPSGFSAALNAEVWLN